MSDDNPFLVDAFLVSHDNYSVKKKEIRNLLLELVQIAQHLGLNNVTKYGFQPDDRKIYQWGSKHEYDMIFQKDRWVHFYSTDPENSKNFTKAQLEKNASAIWNAMFWNWKIYGIDYNDVTDGKNPWYVYQKIKGSPLLWNKIMSSLPTTHAEDTLCDAIRKKIDENQKFISELLVEKDYALKTIKAHERREKQFIEMLEKSKREVIMTEKEFEDIKKSYTELQHEMKDLTESHNAIHQQLQEQITDLEGQIEEKNRNEKHYQDEEKKYKQQIEKLHREIAHNKESAETQIDMIQKNATKIAEELVKETIDQYQSRFHELKETSDAIIAKLQKEILELKKKNTQNKK